MHAGADAVVIVFGLDQTDRQVGLEVENVVGELPLATFDGLAPDHHAAVGEIDLLSDLRVDIPTGLSDGRGDELRANVAFAERFLVEVHHAFVRPQFGLQTHIRR